MGAAHRSKSNMQQASYNSSAESWVLFDEPNVTEATSRLEAKRNYQAFLSDGAPATVVLSPVLGRRGGIAGAGV